MVISKVYKNSIPAHLMSSFHNSSSLFRKLSVYPKGDTRAKGSLSFYLKLHSNASINLSREVYVEFKLSIKNQIGKSHHERTGRVTDFFNLEIVT